MINPPPPAPPILSYAAPRLADGWTTEADGTRRLTLLPARRRYEALSYAATVVPLAAVAGLIVLTLSDPTTAASAGGTRAFSVLTTTAVALLGIVGVAAGVAINRAVTTFRHHNATLVIRDLGDGFEIAYPPWQKRGRPAWRSTPLWPRVARVGRLLDGRVVARVRPPLRCVWQPSFTFTLPDGAALAALRRALRTN